MTPPDPLPPDEPVPPAPPASDELAPLAPAEEESDRSMPQARPLPPEPGVLMSIVWCIALLAALYIALVAVGVVTFVGIGVAHDNPGAFFKAEGEGFNKFAQEMNKPNRPAGQVPSMSDAVSYAIAAGMAAGHVASFVLVIVLLRYVTGREWTRKVALRAPSPAHAVLAAVILPGFMLTHDAVHKVVNEVATLLLGLNDNSQESVQAMIAPWPVWVAVLVLGVGPGIIEELFCRGFLGRGLMARHGIPGGVVLTSAFFGALHLEPRYALGTAVMGVLLHLTYVFTRSLWVTIGMHFLNNTATAIAVTAPNLPGVQILQQDAPPAAYLAAIVLSVAGLWALWTARATIAPDPNSYLGEDRPVWRPRFPGVEYPPAGSGAVVRRGFPHALPLLVTLGAFGWLAYLLVG